MNRATHDDKTCIECIIIGVDESLIQEEGRAFDDLVVNAFLLSIFIDAHVTQNAQTKLAHHGVVLRPEVADGVLGRQQGRELRDGSLAQ